jgi:membrane-associated protein
MIFLNVVCYLLVALSGILGNGGILVGSKSGYYLYNKEDSFWFKHKYLFKSKDFFSKKIW